MVIDAFSKFVWLYATKSTTTEEVIARLRKQAAIFCNPRRIVSDRGTAFTSKDFKEYCREESIEHSLITTGVPRANGQIERLNRTLLPLLTKLAAPRPGEWYRHLDVAQQILNTTTQRSIANTSPYRILFGAHPRLRNRPDVLGWLEEELIESFEDARDELRVKVCDNIAKVQRENRRTFNKRRRKARDYKEGDLVAVKRTQLGSGLKLAHKYFGPYEIIKTLRSNRYLVRRANDGEGPQQTSTTADYMKPWVNNESSSENDDLEDEDHSRANDEEQNGRV